MTVISLFLGGWVASQFTVGENKLEATLHGVILWAVFLALGGLMLTQAAKMGLEAMVGLADSPVAQRVSQEVDDKAVRQRAQQAPEEMRRIGDQAVSASWWGFAGLCLSLLAAIGGTLVGSGPTLRVRAVTVTSPPVTAVPPPR